MVIDEIQRRPDLFPLLRVLADREGAPARFLILGSASLDLVKGVSESLAGRVGFVDLSGFDATEVGFDRLDTLWLRGGFPESFLSESDEASLHWRQQFIRTFLTRDIPQLGITIPSEQLRRFWLMVAHYHGQTWNASEIAGSLGVNYKTAQRYLDILTGAFMIRSLPSWTENLGKRVRKAPKIYLRDSGLFHALLADPLDGGTAGPPQARRLVGGAGARARPARPARRAGRGLLTGATHGGAELDLLLVRGGRRWGFEFKYADAPRTTKSMRVALDDLRLERLFVVYPGEKDYALDDRIHVLALRNVDGLRDATGGAGWRSWAGLDGWARGGLRRPARRAPQFAVECKTGERVISPSVRYAAEQTQAPSPFLPGASRRPPLCRAACRCCRSSSSAGSARRPIGTIRIDRRTRSR